MNEVVQLHPSDDDDDGRIFDFDGNEVRVIKIGGEPWWVAADVCSILGLVNVGNALARLDNLDIRSADVQSARGQQRDTKLVNEAGLYNLIFASRKPAAKQFRRWIFKTVLPEIRKTGAYIDPSATADQLDSIAKRAITQAQVLRELQGIVDPAWLEAKARHVAARALGEEPEIDATNRPLTVGEYLQDRGYTNEQLRSQSSMFGRRLKAAYVLEHGENPQKVPRFVDGALRDVYGYTEMHRSLFDQVWTGWFA